MLPAAAAPVRATEPADAAPARSARRSSVATSTGSARSPSASSPPAAGAWNEDARFPAASTVKLGVLVAALDRLGARDETIAERASAHGVVVESRRQPAGGHGRWHRDRGRGLAPPGRPLEHLPGRVPGRNSARRRDSAAAARLLPRDDGRRPDARDGDDPCRGRRSRSRAAASRAEPGGGRARARPAALLRAERRQRRRCSTRSSPKLPIAQKHGWISSARHTTAIVYGPRGPVASRSSATARIPRSPTRSGSARR